MEKMRGTPLELGSEMNIFELTGFGQRSGGIEMGRILAARLRCKQHDRQHVSLLVPDGLLESLPRLASMPQVAILGTRCLLS